MFPCNPQRCALRFCPVVAVVLASTLALIAQDSQPAPAKPKSVGALGIGWTYIYADVGAGERESINGWYARPSINLPRGYSLFADFTNYYGTTKKGSLNSHGDTLGIAKKVIDTKKISSTVFAESGVVRTSNVTVVNQFAFNAGFNLSIPINKRIAFTMTPAEWIFLYPDGDPATTTTRRWASAFRSRTLCSSFASESCLLCLCPTRCRARHLFI